MWLIGHKRTHQKETLPNLLHFNKFLEGNKEVNKMILKGSASLKHERDIARAGLRVRYPIIRKCGRLPAKKIHPYLHGIMNFYKTQGSFSIRQFYYAVLSGRIPNCSFKVKTSKQATSAYARIQSYCTSLRLWGILPFEAILDETQLYGIDLQYISLKEYLERQTEHYRSNWFNDQNAYTEVWCEKIALAQIIGRETEPLGLYLSVSGKFPTWSQLNSFKQRCEAYETNNTLKKPLKGYILYFGDYDPTGCDMDRFIGDALTDLDLFNVQVERISISHKEALNLSNVGVPLKKKDKKTKKYIRRTGLNYGIELDALTPTELRQRVKQAISIKVDLNKIQQKIAQDKIEASKMKSYLKQFP